MNWSFSLGRVSNIDIRVHFTFFFILLFGAMQWGGSLGNGQAALFGVLVTLLLFACVLLHELGHSLVAQRLGIPVKQILLMPLGGVALLGRNPDKPRHELVIAAAGPLVNVAIIAVLLVLMPLLGIDLPSLVGGQPAPGLDTLVWWMLLANISLVLFNLIPAFPLDGGRMFRALLAMRIGHARATQIASRVGQLLAVGLGFVGLFTTNFLLILVAAFVFFGASAEAGEARAREILGRVKARDAANRHAASLSVGDRLSQVMPLMIATRQTSFAVMFNGQVLGVVTEADLRRAVAAGTGDAYIAGIMQRDFLRVDAEQTLYEVRTMLAEKNSPVAAVYDGEAYLGLVTLGGIQEILRLWLTSQPGQTGSPSQPSGTVVGRA